MAGTLCLLFMVVRTNVWTGWYNWLFCTLHFTNASVNADLWRDISRVRFSRGRWLSNMARHESSEKSNDGHSINFLIPCICLKPGASALSVKCQRFTVNRHPFVPRFCPWWRRNKVSTSFISTVKLLYTVYHTPKSINGPTAHFHPSMCSQLCITIFGFQ